MLSNIEYARLMLRVTILLLSRAPKLEMPESLPRFCVDILLMGNASLERSAERLLAVERMFTMLPTGQLEWRQPGMPSGVDCRTQGVRRRKEGSTGPG